MSLDRLFHATAGWPMLLCMCCFAGTPFFRGTVSAIKSPDILVLKGGQNVRLAGIVPPADSSQVQELVRMLTRQLVSRRVEVHPDSLLVKQAKIGKSQPRQTMVPAYVYYACDTCGPSGTAPELKGQVIVTSHSPVHLNRLLLESGHCRADSTSNYEKKNYFLYLESKQVKAENP